MGYQLTDWRPGDSEAVMLGKLLQLFKGSPKSNDSVPVLLRKILEKVSNITPAVTNPPAYGVTSLGDVAPLWTVDFSKGAYQKGTLSGDVVLSGATNMQPGQRVAFVVSQGVIPPVNVDLAGDALSWKTIEYPLTLGVNVSMFGILECFGTTNADIWFRAWKK